jgi:hypothetical protein
MVSDPNNSILGESETTFEVGSSEIKDRVDELAAEETQEAKDEMFSIAKDHGVSVTPSMSAEEIKESINGVL